MPFINNNKPSFLNRESSSLPQRPADKKPESLKPQNPSPIKKEKEFLSGNPPLSSHESSKFSRYIRSPVGRRELLEKVGMPIGKLYSPEMEQVIKDTEQNVEKFGTIIDPIEAQSLENPASIMKDYYAKKQRTAEELEDNIVSPEEIKKRDWPKREKKFLKGWLGFGKGKK